MRKKLKKETNPNPKCPICSGSKILHSVECSTCHGKGNISYKVGKSQCKICNGNGYTIVKANNLGRDDTTEKCDMCFGTGFRERNKTETCWDCKGTGRVEELCSRCNTGVHHSIATKQEAALEKIYTLHDRLDRERKERAFNSIFFILAAIVYGGSFVYRLMHHSVENWSLMANIAGAWYYNLIIAPFVIPWKYVYSLHLMSKAVANGFLALVAIAVVWWFISYVLGRAYKFVNPYNDEGVCLASNALFFLAPAICFLVYLIVLLFKWCL